MSAQRYKYIFRIAQTFERFAHKMDFYRSGYVFYPLIEVSNLSVDVPDPAGYIG